MACAAHAADAPVHRLARTDRGAVPLVVPVHRIDRVPPDDLVIDRGDRPVALLVERELRLGLPRTLLVAICRVVPLGCARGIELLVVVLGARALVAGHELPVLLDGAAVLRSDAVVRGRAAIGIDGSVPLLGNNGQAVARRRLECELRLGRVHARNLAQGVVLGGAVIGRDIEGVRAEAQLAIGVAVQGAAVPFLGALAVVYVVIDMDGRADIAVEELVAGELLGRGHVGRVVAPLPLVGVLDVALVPALLVACIDGFGCRTGEQPIGGVVPTARADAVGIVPLDLLQVTARHAPGGAGPVGLEGLARLRADDLVADLVGDDAVVHVYPAKDRGGARDHGRAVAVGAVVVERALHRVHAGRQALVEVERARLAPRG